MTTATFRCLATTAGALLATGVLVGCGSAQVGGTGSASAPHTASKSAASSAISSSAVPTSIQPSAQNGTNYNACLGGDCEIAVSKPVTITLSESPIDAGPFTVQKVNADSVEVSMALPAGPSLSATIKKGCTTAFHGNNASGLAHTSCSGEPEDIPGMYVKQTVTVKDISNGTAILNLKSE
ncbi:hypothetical protein [Amycolatopsis anabasis]|uniref:hypothetical protein n=1 Tax=Amycolatopsis anabasis TaxID=1840409 RepID=UPI00131C6CD8|nr:hypothetical protein [Amycolatopsis anabasis]